MKLEYDPLLEATSEIRLLTLPPGTIDDPEKIQFRLWHTPLYEPVKVPSTRLSLREVNKTLPQGWRVHETNQYDYRYLFEQIETEDTTWTHPDPACDTTYWAPEMQLPPTDYEPEYEALSYTWESAETPEVALVEYHGTTGNPQAEFRTLPIGQNLAKALRHLRRPYTSRTLWVDAVCINQEDLSERERQVKRMATLYRLAQRVVVWLGPASHDSDTAMSSLKYLGSQIEISSNRHRLRAPAALEPEWFRAMCPLPFSEEVWMAIGSLFERSWFERLWIWQEIQLANSNAIVVCGKSELLWQNLRKAIIALFTKHELPMLHLRTRLDFIRTLTLETRDCSFSVMTKISRSKGCMDPRDKIYGMLSLCNPRLAEKVETSYTKDAAEVYKDVFLQYSLQNQRLELLLDCGLSLRLPSSPSWVPNWAIGRDSYPLFGFCCTSGISRSETRYTASDRLQVTGLEVFRVQAVTTEAPSHPSEALSIIRCWEPPDLLTRMYVNKERLVDAYCTTLRAGYLRDRWPKNRVPSLEEWKLRYLAMVSSEEARKSRRDPPLHVDIEWMLKIVRGRVMMTTEDGYIGLGPSGARPGKTSKMCLVCGADSLKATGDTICILLGCQQPIVLRSHTDVDAFEVIGECYVDALEDSVAILGSLPPHVRPQRRHASRGSSVIQTFLDLNTGLTCSEGPRLQSIGECGDWESVPHDRNADDPEIYEYYKNKGTGEVVNSDPRLLPSALRESGVPLRTFDLI